MHEYEGFKRAGTFRLTDGTELEGELCLKGAATTLDLYSGAPFDIHASPDVFGLLYDRSKVSLINCIRMSQREQGTGGNYHQRSSVFPHFVIFGDRHIGSSDRVIREVTFTVDDAPMLFYDCDAFGLVIKARPHMERIAEEMKGNRKIGIGEHPELFYFTGKYEILSVDTVIGKISARHGVSYRFPGPTGIHVDNTIRVNIAFTSEKTIEEAIASLFDVLRFLEVIAGRPQNASDLAFVPVSDGEYPSALDAYWCMPPKRDSDDGSRSPHPADLPIQATMKPDEFTSVLKHWLERNDSWRNARVRFSTAFAQQRRYDIDRIVGAANMFDILPASAYPATVTLPPDLEQARDNARQMFGNLPWSLERDSVLSALGRIGTATLKRKARSRAKLITDVVGNRFPDLDLVVDQAIDCRNYYVHGSKAKIDYGQHFEQVHFFTDTLEFVFAASDLVESGWDITAWTKQGSTLSHPFGEYLVNYSRRLGALKELLQDQGTDPVL